jgi:hypothetical protein
MLLKDKIAVLALELALRRPAPSSIPRSLPKAKGVDSFVIQIGESDEKWPFLANSSNSQGLEGLWWDGDNYSLPCCLAFKDIGSKRIEITHYISVYEFTYYSPLRFLIAEVSLYHWWFIVRDKIKQAIFNRRKLVRGDRIQVLRIILEESVQKRDFKLSPTMLMGLLYSNRWVFHPDKDSLIRYCYFLLASLAASGDLMEQQGSYSLAGKALATISQFEEDYRRHRDLVILQSTLALLTVALVIVGAIQAYVAWIKL